MEVRKLNLHSDNYTGVPSMSDENDYVSVGTAADILGVTPQTIRRMIKRGDIPAEGTIMGKTIYYRIKRSDLDNVTINPPHRPSKSSNKTET